jgi:hypothetical protein
MLFVRDQERSLRFYVDQLGFRVVVDERLASGGHWIEIAPADGNACLSLAQAAPDTDAYKLIGQDTRIYFITEESKSSSTNGAIVECAFTSRRRNRNGEESSHGLKM